MRYYHFTRLAPGRWDPTRRYRTLEPDQSLYWRGVFARASYDAEYRRARRLLGSPRTDDVALLAAIAGRDYLLACMRELLFESVRAEIAPGMPSRSTCLFLVEEGSDLDAWARRFGFENSRRAILQIEALDGGTAFRGRAADLDTGPIAADISEAAVRYWQGAPAASPADDVEVLYQGPFRIVGVEREAQGAALELDGRGFAEIFAARDDRSGQTQPAVDSSQAPC